MGLATRGQSESGFFTLAVYDALPKFLLHMTFPLDSIDLKVLELTV